MIEQKRPRGRPKLPPGERMRRNVTFRVRDAVFERMLEAADHRQLSVSEMVEKAVEQFFVSDDLARAVRETIRQEMRAERDAMRAWDAPIAIEIARQ